MPRFDTKKRYVNKKGQKFGKGVWLSDTGSVLNPGESYDRDNTNKTITQYNTDGTKTIFTWEQWAKKNSKDNELRVLQNDRRYGIPVEQDKMMTISIDKNSPTRRNAGSTFSENLLDSIAINAKRENVPFSTGLGIVSTESTFGTNERSFGHTPLPWLRHLNEGESSQKNKARNISYKDTYSPSLLISNWNQRNEDPFHHYFYNSQGQLRDTPRTAEFYEEDFNFSRNKNDRYQLEEISPLQHAFRQYKKDPTSYNPNDTAYPKKVEANIRELTQYSPEIKAYMRKYNLKAEGGSLRPSWDDLSLTEKSEMMKVAIKNGITDLSNIRQKYNEFAEGGPEETYNVGYIPEVTIEAERTTTPYTYYDPWSRRYKGIGVGGQRIEYGEGFNPEGSILLPNAQAYENQRLIRAKQDDLNHTYDFGNKMRNTALATTVAPMAGPLVEAAQVVGDAAYAGYKALPWLTQQLIGKGTQAAFAADGLYNFFGPEGTRKTTRLINEGKYGDAALSAIGNILNLSMAAPVLKVVPEMWNTGKKGLKYIANATETSSNPIITANNAAIVRDGMTDAIPFQSNLDWSADNWFKGISGRSSYSQEEAAELASFVPEYHQIEEQLIKEGTLVFDNSSNLVVRGSSMSPQEYIMRHSKEFQKMNPEHHYVGVSKGKRHSFEEGTDSDFDSWATRTSPKHVEEYAYSPKGGNTVDSQIEQIKHQMSIREERHELHQNQLKWKLDHGKISREMYDQDLQSMENTYAWKQSEDQKELDALINQKQSDPLNGGKVYDITYPKSAKEAPVVDAQGAHWSHILYDNNGNPIATSTDHIVSANKGLGYDVTHINNVMDTFDGTLLDESIIHRGVPIKSVLGNTGKFALEGPHKFKRFRSVIPWFIGGSTLFSTSYPTFFSYQNNTK